MESEYPGLNKLKTWTTYSSWTLLQGWQRRRSFSASGGGGSGGSFGGDGASRVLLSFDMDL